MFFLSIECNGNSLTKLMHLVVFNELNRMRVKKQPRILDITPEKTVLLEKKGRERQGRFDFLVRTGQGMIGVEVLSRQSQGKLKEKLAYSREVDKFIFAIPSNSMEFYRKRKMNGFKRIAPKKFLEKEFSDKKLKVWLIDCRKGQVTEKGSFSKVFEVR